MSDSVDKPAKADLPSRRAPEAYWKRATPDPRILRRWFGRRAMLDMAREMLWLAPLTAVIWIYAEREQITQPIKVDTSVNVTSSDRGRFVQPSDNVPVHVMLVLQGPQSSVEKVREQLTTSIPRGVTIDIGDDLPPGPRQLLDVIDRIQNQALFKANGVTVTESQPPQVSVNVDTIEEREVAVQVPPRVANLTTSATFEPRKVRVRGPSSVLAQMVDQGNLKIYADIAASDVKTPGKKDLPSVPLTASQADSGLAIEPPNVHATLDIRAADITGTIPSVPIAIETLPGLLRNNDVVLNGGATLANVRVIGPPETVNELVAQQLPARAVVDVDASGQARLKFELPEGVHPAPGETERPIDVSLHRRDNGG